MAPKAFGTNNLILVFSVIFLISATSTSGFNITRLLDNHPDFSTFNELLSKTGVAKAINTHKTITVLVVANKDLGGLQDKPEASIKDILATHVLLDYFDTMKFNDLSKKTALITNLFQSSGYANKEQGFLNVTTSGGEVVFGSAVKGASHDAKMVKSVAAQPYTISVIQISKPIIAPGLDQNAPTSSSSPKGSPSPAAAPPPKKAGEEEAENEEAEGSTEEEGEGSTDEEAEGPEAEGPDAESPLEDMSDVPSPAPAPVLSPEEARVADESEPKLVVKDAGARGVAHVGVMVACLLGLVSLAL